MWLTEQDRIDEIDNKEGEITYETTKVVIQKLNTSRRISQ